MVRLNSELSDWWRPVGCRVRVCFVFLWIIFFVLKLSGFNEVFLRLIFEILFKLWWFLKHSLSLAFIHPGNWPTDRGYLIDICTFVSGFVTLKCFCLFEMWTLGLKLLDYTPLKDYLKYLNVWLLIKPFESNKRLNVQNKDF